MTTILLATLLLVAAKDTACVWGLVNQMRGGGAMVSRLDNDEATQAEFDAYVTESNPLDRGLDRLKQGAAKTTLAKVFRSWFTVSAGTLIVLAVAGKAPARIILALGIITALNAVLHIVTAVVRRLILGHHDSRATDVQVATLARQWAVARDPRGNLSFYFGACAVSVGEVSAM